MRTDALCQNGHLAKTSSSVKRRRWCWAQLVKRQRMPRRSKIVKDDEGKKQSGINLKCQDRDGISYSLCKQNLENKVSIALQKTFSEVEQNLEDSKNYKDFGDSGVKDPKAPYGDVTGAFVGLHALEEVDLNLVDNQVEGSFECAHCHYMMERVRANFKAGKARMTCVICGWTTVRRLTLVRSVVAKGRGIGC